MVAVFHWPAGKGCQAGEFGAAALPQGEPADAARGEFVEHLVGGQLGVEDEQPGVFAGGVAPVVGEGDDFAGLLGLGDFGVGVDHLGAGVVLGEEGEHGAGALRAARHVVFLQHGVVAVVADGVEVEVESLGAAGESEWAQRLDHAGEQFGVGFSAHPVGVGAGVGGLGQRGQSQTEREAGVVGERVDVMGAVAACALGQQQGADRLPGRDRRGGRVAGLGHQLGQAELGHRREQQQQSGVVTRDLRGHCQLDIVWTFCQPHKPHTSHATR